MNQNFQNEIDILVATLKAGVSVGGDCCLSSDGKSFIRLKSRVNDLKKDIFFDVLGHCPFVSTPYEEVDVKTTPKAITVDTNALFYLIQREHGFSCKHFRWASKGEPCSTATIANVMRIALEPFGFSQTEINNKAKAFQNYVQAEQDKKDRENSDDLFKVLTYEDVDENKVIEFLYKPWFLMGCLNSLQAPSGVGKSVLMYAIGAKFSRGLDILGTPCSQKSGNVMFITLEDSQEEIKQSFMGAGGDPARLRRLTPEAIGILRFSDYEIIKRIVTENDIKLLVFDPIQDYLDGDINKTKDVVTQLEYLRRVASETNCCILLIRHENKLTKENASTRGMGSGAIRSMVRSQVVVTENPNNPDELIAYHEKHNNTKRGNAIFYTIDSNGEDKKGFAKFLRQEHYTERDLIKAQALAEGLRIDDTISNEPMIQIAQMLLRENPNGVMLTHADYKEIYRRQFKRELTESIGKTANRIGAKATSQVGIDIESIRTQGLGLPYMLNGESHNNLSRHDSRITFKPLKQTSDDYSEQLTMDE